MALFFVKIKGDICPLLFFFFLADKYIILKKLTRRKQTFVIFFLQLVSYFDLLKQ